MPQSTEISPFTRFRESLTALDEAYGRLQQALERPKDSIVRDAAILRFACAFNLAWTTMQKAGSAAGENRLLSPEECIRFSAEKGWLDNPKRWLDYFSARNQTPQAHVEATAEAVFALLPAFSDALKVLRERLDAFGRSEG